MTVPRRGVFVLLACAIAMPFMVFGLVRQVAQNTDSNEANADTIRRICLSDNRQDAKQKAFWEAIIALPTLAPPAGTQQQQAEQLRLSRAILDDTYKPQNCQ